MDNLQPVLAKIEKLLQAPKAPETLEALIAQARAVGTGMIEAGGDKDQLAILLSLHGVLIPEIAAEAASYDAEAREQYGIRWVVRDMASAVLGKARQLREAGGMDAAFDALVAPAVAAAQTALAAIAVEAERWEENVLAVSAVRPVLRHGADRSRTNVLLDVLKKISGKEKNFRKEGGPYSFGAGPLEAAGILLLYGRNRREIDGAARVLQGIGAVNPKGMIDAIREEDTRPFTDLTPHQKDWAAKLLLQAAGADAADKFVAGEAMERYFRSGFPVDAGATAICARAVEKAYGTDRNIELALQGLSRGRGVSLSKLEDTLIRHLTDVRHDGESLIGAAGNITMHTCALIVEAKNTAFEDTARRIILQAHFALSGKRNLGNPVPGIVAGALEELPKEKKSQRAAFLANLALELAQDPHAEFSRKDLDLVARFVPMDGLNQARMENALKLVENREAATAE